MTTRWFLKLPPEIRNQIYVYCIESTIVDYVIDWSALSYRKATRITRSFALSQTCKQIRKEYLSLWMSTVAGKISLFRLQQYLQKLYPLHGTPHPHAKIHLLLPHNTYRCYEPCSVTDITHLLRLMVESEYFTCTVGQVSQNHDLALAEAHELEEVLRNVSRKARPFLNPIISVPLLMRKAGWRNAQPYTLFDEQQRPTIYFTFEEHKTQPGEWPWYGAHGLNHENLLLWKRWLGDRGVFGLQRWYINFTVQRVANDAAQLTSV